MTKRDVMKVVVAAVPMVRMMFVVDDDSLDSIHADYVLDVYDLFRMIL
jgi:hypothetical protein